MSTNFSPEQQTRLEQMEVTSPDVLLNARTSTATPVSIAISVVVHIVFLGVFSIGLFADWAHYGIQMPATIRDTKAQEQADALAAEQTLLEAERAAKAEAAAEKKAAEEAKNKKPGEKDPTKPETKKPSTDIGETDPFGDL